jgi:cell division protease FtsH
VVDHACRAKVSTIVSMSTAQAMLSSRPATRAFARNADRLRSRVLGVPRRSVHCFASSNPKEIVSPLRPIRNQAPLFHLLCLIRSWSVQSTNLAAEFVNKLPVAALASLVALASSADVASADVAFPPPTTTTTTAPTEQVQELKFQNAAPLAAPAVSAKAEYQLPEGNQWRYSEFVNAVENGKVERVRFSKDGTQLQLTAVDGRRAMVVLPNDPDLVDVLAKNGVDISVSEGDQQGNYVALLGNLLFPLIAFGGLFFLFRRAQNGGGGAGPMGGMGGPMEFGKSKSKFQEVPETGVLFNDVAVSLEAITNCIIPLLVVQLQVALVMQRVVQSF